MLEYTGRLTGKLTGLLDGWMVCWLAGGASSLYGSYRGNVNLMCMNVLYCLPPIRLVAYVRILRIRTDYT